MELLGHGAEGRVFATLIHGKPAVIKERASKRYRVAELDLKLTKQRLIQEPKCMAKSRRAGVLTPTLLFVDKVNNSLYMERIIGESVKTVLKAIPDIATCDTSLPLSIGRSIALMHDADVVHGIAAFLLLCVERYLFRKT